jgi:hypothetical protein
MIYLTQLVYVHEGREATFHQFEDIVLPLLAKYRGELVLRLRPDHASKIAGTADVPYELHIVSFHSEDDVARYSKDEERQRVLHLKDESVRRTTLITGLLS